MNIFIINLPDATERREFQQKQLTELGLNFEIINATSINDISEDTYKKHYYDWQRPLQKTEVACYFSHQKLWTKIAEGNQPALILEDDVALSKYTPNILKELEKRTNLEMVNLEVFEKKKTIAKISQTIGNHQLFCLYQDKAGAAAYVLYPKGAKKLLQHQQKHGIALADAHLHNCPSLQSYQIEPACAVQSMFCQKYGIEQYDIVNTSCIEYKKSKEKRSFIFRVKRIVGQVKLGFRQLSFVAKSDKRYIEVRIDDFKR
ncbi:MAG: hypothetical protein DSY43_03810 [Gammaproteobacteria bacterium]|uniref:Glycosyl transferase family 25 n=1 Tax=endosymbiont of Bathymodiolus septemdierum str. Myojin knoll TaxID=1303921 RepID=A0A0P0URE7_9GAMM|nr:glycosyltransferase family 25 protein [Bathymodiolus septemdierum thioautotrophic gill symbiont]RUA05736.1 MAG: hypothetical protein DSY43_03810 [Gammaproteobacteria bacterium]BAS67678.1 glycosyl transferase family 25 [endosymbiont of Bathymodiolus septemdierum str. Myojin knoll]